MALVKESPRATVANRAPGLEPGIVGEYAVRRTSHRACDAYDENAHQDFRGRLTTPSREAR
jgi:hypothetical protein